MERKIFVQFKEPRTTTVSIEGCDYVADVIDKIQEKFPSLKEVDPTRITLHYLDSNSPEIANEKHADTLAVGQKYFIKAATGPEKRMLDYPIHALPLPYVPEIRPRSPPQISALPRHWPEMVNKARPDIRRVLTTAGTIAIMAGRRRIGKTQEVSSVCLELYKSGYRILYLEAEEALTAFHINVCEALDLFDSQIQHPAKSELAVFGLIWWLMQSGVLIIIDEIQRLTVNMKSFFNRFKTVYDRPKLNASGSFLGFGSHVTEVTDLVRGGSAMYKQGVEEILFEALEPAQILDFFNKLRIPKQFWLPAYACSGRIIGYYADQFAFARSRSNPLEFSESEWAKIFETEALIEELRKNTTGNVRELGADLSAFFQSVIALSKKDRTKSKIFTKLLTKFGHSNGTVTRYLSILVAHGYLRKEFPILLRGGSSGEERYVVSDCRLFMEEAIVDIEDKRKCVEAWEQAEGQIFEALVNDILHAQANENCKILTHNSFWADKGVKTVEIDLVAVINGTHYIWGSLKRNPSDLKRQNFDGHLEAIWPSVTEGKTTTHSFVYVSPTIASDIKEKLQKSNVVVLGVEFDTVQCIDLGQLGDPQFKLG